MKLKGKNSKKLKDEDRKKKEKTLKRMEETRAIDSSNLRAQINKKIEVLVGEKKKATTHIENFKDKIIELEELSLRIDGALVTLKELVSNDINV
ncbi:MAG: hypothetical protein ACTSYR_03405 [Candidatus Odinarchaeia archaeon]